MPNFISVSFGSPYVHYANTNAGDTYDSNLTAIFTGFAANANIQISCTEYTNQEDFYDVQTSYSAPYTTVTCQRIFDDYYANSSNLSLPCVWTFTDLNNVGSNVATATFALPMTTITGNTIYQSYNINDLNDYNIYNYCNFLQLGNSCTVNLLTLYPYETVTFTGGFANGTFRSPTYSTLGTVSADANGIVTYTFSVQQNSNAFYLAVSSNTINYTYGGIIFDQNEINVANSNVIEGYAWTPYDYQNSNTAILANVSVYANSVLLGNTTTNVYGMWSYPVPNTFSNGTYLITAKSVPQNPSALLGAATIPVSNASAYVVINTTFPSPNIAITYPSNGQTVYSTLITGTSNVVGTVHLYNGNVAIANVSSGNYTWSATPTLSYGTYTITAEIANTSGTAYANVTFDYAAPINVKLAWDTGVSSTDNVSSQSEIIGTGFSNAVITVYDTQNGMFLGNVVPDGNGNFSVDFDYSPGYQALTFQQQVGNTIYQVPFSFEFTTDFGTQNFLSVFFDLLPNGDAWPKYQGSNMYSALLPLMRCYRRIEGRIRDFYTETFPATPNELLPEWEATLGLVASDNESTATRQANVLAKFLANGGLSIPYYESVANTLGYNIAVQTYAPFRAGFNKAGQQLAPPSAMFIWTVTANSAASSSTLANTITTLAPANTIVYFNYD